MTDTITLVMVDGVRIVVPNSLELITPYVLQEQQDWFEDEIRFIRHLLHPGQKVIDIGACYGVYTLAMARRVGPTGCVWAFEPASSSASLLTQGITANGFTQVVLEQSALSSSSGTAQLSILDTPELNSFTHDPSSVDRVESVPVVTLDECLAKYEWQNIEFLKIDAEGEESAILEGGKQFFSELSPLVQYEVKEDRKMNLELVNLFASYGYSSFRLVPGLNLLAPYDEESSTNKFLLNLFGCKPDRREKLASSGFLVDSSSQPSAQPSGETLAQSGILLGKWDVQGAYGWQHTLAQLPYGRVLSKDWEQTMGVGDRTEVEKALALYALSQNVTFPATERFEALETCFLLFKALCDDPQSPSPQLSSLARVAQDYGERPLALTTLQLLIDTLIKGRWLDLSEPFLAPGKRFDFVPPGDDIFVWLAASALEEFERLASFSSYFTQTSSHERLKLIHSLGFASEDMERRFQLTQRMLT